MRAGTERVIVVDDQPLERTGVALILDSDDHIEVVAEADSGESAIELVDREQPDVVLMDVRMPGMGGLEATRVITQLYPTTKVVVFTTFDLDEYAFGSLRAGASAFLVKSIKLEGLVEAVKTVAACDSVVAPRVTARLIEHFLTEAGQEPVNASAGKSPGMKDPATILKDITPREHDIFLLIVRGLNNAEISSELQLAESTVKSHINSIFAKLHLRDRVHAVILGYELQAAGWQPQY